MLTFRAIQKGVMFMHLRIYLAERNMSKTDFALELGICRQYMAKVLRGTCSKRLADRVEVVTNGIVKATDVCQDYNTRVFKPRGWQVSKKRKKNDRTRNKR